MKENKGTSSAGGVTFVGLLQIAFIVLKLTKVINWEWGWVLAPLWVSAAICIIGLVVF